MIDSGVDDSDLLIEVRGTSGLAQQMHVEHSSVNGEDFFPHGTTPVRNSAEAASAEISTSAAELQASIKRIVRAVAGALHDAGPSEWSVEFGISFKSSAGIPVLVSGEAGANLKVVLSWKR